MVVIATIAVGVVILLLLALLGGFGLTLGVFSGLTSIPIFVWIALIILIALLLFKKVTR